VLQHRVDGERILADGDRMMFDETISTTPESTDQAAPDPVLCIERPLERRADRINQWFARIRDEARPSQNAKGKARRPEPAVRGGFYVCVCRQTCSRAPQPHLPTNMFFEEWALLGV